MPRPSRREVLAAGASALAVSALPLPLRRARGDEEPRRPPNVVFVLSDSHRGAALGCAGDGQIATPNFDALAAQGVRLTTAVSNTPLCRPYRASLMTGQYGHHNGMLTNVGDLNFGVSGRRQWDAGARPTLGRVFRDAGYVCGYVGKWHLGSVRLDAGDPLRLGFDDVWYGALNPVHDYWKWSYSTDAEEVIEGEGRFRPAVETDLAIEFLEQHGRGDRPFFLVLSWGPPHDPFVPPPRYVRHTDMELPPNLLDNEEATAAARELLPLYYGLIEAIDFQFGRLAKALDELGLADDTVVVYTSDHGNQMGSHAMIGKEVPYRESTEVPFLLRWPGRVEPGSTLDMPLGAVDVFPTLAGLAGLDVPSAGLDGGDFSGALSGAAGAKRQADTYLAAWDTVVVPRPGWRGLRTPTHLYARTAKRPWLLFDLAADPWQLENLVQDEQELVEELDARTLELMDELGDGWV